MASTNKDYFNVCHVTRNIVGLTSGGNLLIKFVSFYVLYPLLITLYFLMAVNFFYKHSNIAEIAEVFNSLTSYGHFVVRKTMLIVHRTQFEHLNQKRQRFWEHNIFGEKNTLKFHKNMSFAVTFIKFLWFAGAVSTSLHTFAPFFVEGLRLPFSCWIPGDNEIIRRIIHVLEGIFLAEAVVLTGTFDGFYLLMCTELKIQFELLVKTVSLIRIEEEETEKYWKKFITCINYHRFLLNYHKQFNSCFSEYFVCLYFLTVGGICVPVFVMLNETSGITQVMQSLIVIVLINYVFMMAMFPADEVNISAESLGNAIYGIDWYNARDLKTLKFILFWLARAQKPLQMTGANIIEVNRVMMLRIQRIGYSISTVMTGTK